MTYELEAYNTDCRYQDDVEIADKLWQEQEHFQKDKS